MQEIVYTPIANDATRLAALVSGEIDFVLDPAPRDIARLRNTAGVKVIDGPENRIVFIGMDQRRDKLLYGSVQGTRTRSRTCACAGRCTTRSTSRRCKTKLMNGQSVPTGGITPSPLGSLQRPAARDAPALRPGRGARADGRGRLRRRLRGHARLPEQPLHQRRGDLHRAGRHVGADQGQGQGQRDAARDLLPEDGEARHQPVHARLGRRRSPTPRPP